MKIIEAQGTPNGRRVRVFLAEKGIEVPAENIDLRAADNLSEDHRKKNPMGRIPVLALDDGTYISESVAICRYFEELHPAPALFGSSPLQKATIEMWNRRAELNFMLPGAQAFRHLSRFFEDREVCSEEAGKLNLDTAAAALPVFDEHLSASEFLAGDEFSIADITFGCSLDFLQAVKLDMPFESANLVKYRERLATRPSWAAR